MTNTSAKRLFLLACALTVAVACRAKIESKIDPTRAAFERGLQAYLARRGDLCVGRPTLAHRRARRCPRDADAVQLPVLEQVGLAKSTISSSGSMAGRRRFMRGATG